MQMKLNEKHRVRVAWVSSAIVVIAAVVFWPRSQGPVYSGKRLTYWLDRLPMTDPHNDNLRFPPPNRFRTLEETNGREGLDAMSEEALQVVRSVGTNALPFLVKRLRGAVAPQVLYLRTRALELRLISPKQMGIISPASAEPRRYQALTGIIELREQAALAVPDLQRMLRDSNPKVRETALCALKHIVPAEAIFSGDGASVPCRPPLAPVR
jgi:hypothetical protein